MKGKNDCTLPKLGQHALIDVIIDAKNLFNML